MYHPFADLIGLKFLRAKNSKIHCMLVIEEKHLNPNKVVHGAVAYALADTGMGAALYSAFEKGTIKSMATVEIKINYFRPATAGELHCKTKVIHCGKKLANLESEIWEADKLIARANSTFFINLITSPNKAQKSD